MFKQENGRIPIEGSDSTLLNIATGNGLFHWFHHSVFQKGTIAALRYTSSILASS